MRQLYLFVFLCALAGASLGLGFPLHAKATAPAPIQYSQWSLANGLRIIAVPDNTTSTVTTSIWYEVGSKHDPQGKAGLAHLVEHIASRKTENIPYNLIYSLTADVGGVRNASNWVDRTNYWEQVPAQYLETMVWTHAERMARLVIDEEVFEAEREVVKQELRQRVLAPPYERLQRIIIPENAFDHLPHRRPGIGTLKDLDAITLADVRAFHEAYYSPDAAVLIVAGNFEVPVLRQMIQRYFGEIPARANPVSRAIPAYEPPLTTARQFHASAPNVPVPALGAIWKAPPVTHKDVPSLKVMMAVLASGRNNRLQSALLRSGIALEVTAIAPLFREGGFISLYALARLDRFEASSKALFGQVVRLQNERVSPAELAEAKAEIFAEALRQRETARGRAFALGEALAASGDAGFADRLLAEITEVSAKDVQRAARRYLDLTKSVGFTYRLGPYDTSAFANPTSPPDFGALPLASHAVREVKPEADRAPVPQASNSPAVERPLVSKARLDNGIAVFAARTGDVPMAAMTMVVPGGSKSDPEGLDGLADLAAHLAPSGIHGMDAQSIAARFESLGARFDGSADADGTSFTLTAPTQHLGEAAMLAGRIIKGAIYPSDELARARALREETVRAAMQDPSQIAQSAARKVIYGNSPYSRQTRGNLASLSRINRNHLLLHRQRFFHPSRMQIVTSGGIDGAEAIRIAGEAFGDWQVTTFAGQIVDGLPSGAVEAGPPTARTIVIDLPNAAEASVVAALPLPGRGAEDFDAVQLVNAVLGGGSSGRLFQEIRVKRSAAYGAYSNIEAQRDGSLLIARTQLQGDAVGEVAAVMLGTIEELGKHSIGQELLDRRRRYLEGSYGRLLETGLGFNAVVSGLLLHGLAPSEVGQLDARLAAVTREGVEQAARDYLDLARTTLVVAGKADLFLDDLRALRGDVEVVRFEELDLSHPTLRKQGDE